MRVIGLTGGIASGKSLVTNFLQQLGAEVIDADEVGHKVIEPGLPAFYEIVDYFGSEILDGDGKINRAKLGEIVFSCPKKLQRLNKITHPRIFSEIRDLINNRRQNLESVVIIEAALLFEIGLDVLVDEVWTVEADEEIQVQRLKERNNLTEHEALSRINSQRTASQRIARADKVIYNNTSIEQAYKQVLEIWDSR